MNIASKLMAQMLNGKTPEVELYRVEGEVIHARHESRKKMTYTIERMEDGFKLTTFVKGRYSHANKGTAAVIASWVPVPENVIQALPELEDKTPEVKVIDMDYAETEERVLAHVTTDPELLDEEGKPDPQKCAEKMMMGGRLPGKQTAMEKLTGTKAVDVKPTISHGRRHTKTHERKWYYRCPGQVYPNSVMATSEVKARIAIKEHEKWDRMPNGTEVWEASD